MKPLSFVFLALIVSHFSQAAVQIQAQAQKPCDEYLVRHGAFKFQRFESYDNVCFSGADPFDVLPAMKYRSYLVTNEGLLMVFNSYNATENADATGARVFHFFPRNQTPDIQVSGSQIVYQTATQGLELILSQKKAEILGMKGGKVKESTKLSPSNQGGVEFSSVKFLTLDSGFTLGQDPTGIPDRNSKFIDSSGRTCTVQNKEVFKYSSDGDSSFKFTDDELKNFLKDRCPQLKFNF